MVRAMEPMKRLKISAPPRRPKAFSHAFTLFDDLFSEELDSNTACRKTLRLNCGGLQMAEISRDQNERFKANLRSFIAKMALNVPSKFTGLLHLDFDGDAVHKMTFEMKKSQFVKWQASKKI
jgi:hypothetical protein